MSHNANVARIAFVLNCLMIPGALQGLSAQVVPAAAAAAATSGPTKPDAPPVPPPPAAAAAPAPPLPQKPADPVGVAVSVPYRSKTRLQRFLESVVLRSVCPRGYSRTDRGDSVACSQLDQVDLRGADWHFAKKAANGSVSTLELVTRPSPGRGFELNFLGSRDRNSLENPDVAEVKANTDTLLTELKSLPVGTQGDEIRPYQLSYVQADRAVAILGTLGYPIVEYKKATDSSGNNSSPAVVSDWHFVESTPAVGDRLSRPLIVHLVDSEPTSLVTAQTAVAIGAGTTAVIPDSSLSGGQPLGGVTDAAPQQRLLIVYDGDDLDSLDELLDRLRSLIDVPARQLLIEALVLELTHDHVLDLGVAFSGSKNDISVSSGQNLSGAIQPFTFQFQEPLPETLLHLTASLNALVEHGEATVLSRPSVFVLDGRQARITIGDNLPYTSQVTTQAGAVTSAATAFLKTGIILNLRPRAATDNSSVSMQVETIISSGGPSGLSSNGVLIAPTIESRQVQTLVRVANDTPFVIGGLISTSDQDNSTGIPLLSRIPWLGQLFRNDSRSRNRKEVIVVITPHIIESGDVSLTYSIARDAAAHEESGDGRYAAHGTLAAGTKRCGAGTVDPVFAPVVSSKGGIPESLFDSFDAELFRNVYRIRSSDVFDLTFVTDSEDVTKRKAEFADYARRLPPVKPVLKAGAPLQNDAFERLKTAVCAKATTPECLDPEQARTFKTFVAGGVPGEDILVQNMMIRVVERLGFSACVPPTNIIAFNAQAADGHDSKRYLDPEPVALVEPTAGASLSAKVRNCLAQGNTAILAFPPLPGNDKRFRRECLDNSPPPAGADQLGAFHPPIVETVCKPIEDVDYMEALRRCNQHLPDGTWDGQAILLNRSFNQRRGRNPMALLQSVFALDRVLELNDPNTFPRTLAAFHAGRELVFPTAVDLMTRKHLIGRRTAQLFYETLDYYNAFQEAFERQMAHVQEQRETLQHTLAVQ